MLIFGIQNDLHGSYTNHVGKCKLRIQAEQQEEAAQRKQLMMIQEADQTTSCDINVSINDINVSVVLCGADFVTGHLKCDRCFFFSSRPEPKKSDAWSGDQAGAGLRLRRYGFSQNSQIPNHGSLFTIRNQFYMYYIYI